MSHTVHEGQLSSRRGLWLRGALWLTPGVGWLLALLIVPGWVVAALSLTTRTPYGAIDWTLTLSNFERLLGFGLLGWSADHLLIAARTWGMALVTCVLSLALGLPCAFFIASRPERRRPLWLLLLTLPQCVNLVIRTYAWMLVLAPGSPLSQVAAAVGWVEEGAALYPGWAAVFLAMVATHIPFAVLPLFASVEKLDVALVEAAQDLYAGRWLTFRHAILPQILPGLTVAAVLTFVPALGMFVVPDLLGGARTMLVGNLIQHSFGPARDWPLGAAFSLVLMILTLLGVLLYRRIDAEAP